ncbi:MAG: divalent-cation tolerance protein CutA [Steroidobacteraceae bacterium]|jgi:periplasmic divalent cation tolerance protein|nr:divalent-cation tolerance protein CutA [Steroidobacteraceae bacterium]
MLWGRLGLLAGKSMNPKHIVVLCSCPDEAVASRIAGALVGEGLAACVNRLSGMRSTYRWDGALQDEGEVLLLIKTLGERFPVLEARIRTLHPYEVPEIIGIPVVAGSAQYLDWVSAGSSGPATGPSTARPDAAADR